MIFMRERAEPMSNAQFWQDRWKKAKSPGEPGLFPSTRAWCETGDETGCLGDLAERLIHAALDRLGRIRCDLLRQRAEFLALYRERLELLARVGARQLNDLRQRLCGEQLTGEIERRIGIGAGGVDHLQAVFGRALAGGRIGGLEHVGRLFRGGLHLLVGVLRLGNAPFREFAESGRHFDLRDIEFRHFEFRNFKSARGGLARLGFGGCGGFRHDTVSLIFDYCLITHWAVARNNLLGVAARCARPNPSSPTLMTERSTISGPGPSTTHIALSLVRCNRIYCIA